MFSLAFKEQLVTLSPSQKSGLTVSMYRITSIQVSSSLVGVVKLLPVNGAVSALLQKGYKNHHISIMTITKIILQKITKPSAL